MRPGHWQVDKHGSRRIIYKNQFETNWLFQDLVVEWTGPLHSQRIRDKTVLVFLSFPGRCQIYTMKRKKNTKFSISWLPFDGRRGKYAYDESLK